MVEWAAGRARALANNIPLGNWGDRGEPTLVLTSAPPLDSAVSFNHPGVEAACSECVKARADRYSTVKPQKGRRAVTLDEDKNSLAAAIAKLASPTMYASSESEEAII